MKNKNLYLVLSSEYNKNKSIIEIAKQAILGGVDIIQLREKQMTDSEKINQANELCRLCKENNVKFIVNDDPYIAKEVNADGVHLGQTDIEKYPIRKARQILGDDKIIGISTHNLEQFKDSQKTGCDYLAFGPIFKTKTKDYHIGLTEVSKVLEIATVPVVFIGGINMENISAVLEKGATNIAMIRAIMQAEDILDATRQFKEKILQR